ncbi:MAG: polysaccharide deacetylase family protein [Clostridiales bacterium]|nr:polysaccharide deacetylase family protein [Clostridiales bacterium]
MKRIFSFLLIMITLFAVVLKASAMPLFDKNGKVVVITYHKISEITAEWGEYCISPKIFEEDIKYLKKEGYEFVKASCLAKVSLKGKKTAVITFDDGYESDYKYAVPILEKYGACATFFVFGGGINAKDYLSTAEITEMSKKSCVEIGNHSDRLHTKKYSTLSVMYRDKKYKNEIIGDFYSNAQLIKQLTGYTPTALSYPNGIYSKEIDEALKNSGYCVTFSTVETRFRALTDSPAGRKNRGYDRKIKDIVN